MAPDEPTTPEQPAGRRGRVHSVQVSDGGVPKHTVPFAEVTAAGLSGDRQRDRRHHGGPERAVCLLGLEVIEALAAEGHPIRPGSTGENLTLAGLDWSALEPGTRLAFDGGLRLLITGHATPCPNIAGSFCDGAFERIAHKQHPGWSRLYARVEHPGRIAPGDAVQHL